MHIQWDSAVSTQRQPLYARVTLLMAPVVPGDFFFDLWPPACRLQQTQWPNHLARVPSGVGL